MNLQNDLAIELDGCRQQQGGCTELAQTIAHGRRNRVPFDDLAPGLGEGDYFTADGGRVDQETMQRVSHGTA
jgi:hypothetical protein